MKSEAVVAATAIPLSQRTRALSWEKTTVMVIGLMIVMGLGLRVAGLGRVGFAEDEINKLDAVRAYDRGDFAANADERANRRLDARGARVELTDRPGHQLRSSFEISQRAVGGVDSDSAFSFDRSAV